MVSGVGERYNGMAFSIFQKVRTTSGAVSILYLAKAGVAANHSKYELHNVNSQIEI